MNLRSLGWSPFFAQQISPTERSLHPLRVVAIHRTGHRLSDGELECRIHLGRYWYRQPVEDRPTVGDWVLADPGRRKIVRCLERSNILRRMAAGPKADVQLIGANVDGLFVVTSCNAEFSTARLQRFLALAGGAGIEPLIVLTKADLAKAPVRFLQQAEQVAGGVAIKTVDARDAATLAGVRTRLQAGRTVALLGSSGVGKSTLLNTLAGRSLQETRPIREQDAKGRHTTTYRSLNRLPDGALVLDGPGMRELGVAVAEEELSEVYDEIEALASRCRFADCRHQTEPDCAIRAAVQAGELDSKRLRSYFKLQRERRRHEESRTERNRRASRIERARWRHTELE